MAMKRQSGISTAAVALVLVLVGAAAGGYFGWQQHRQLVDTKADLGMARLALDRASADARAAKADATAARQELESQKAALQQALSEAELAKAGRDMEKARSERLQADLTLAREQIAFMRTRGGGAMALPQQPPMIVRPAPSRIDAIQVQRSAPQAVGAGAPARAPQ
jgi:hypothetical protein